MVIAETKVEGKLNKDVDDDDTDNSSSKIKLQHVISFSDAIFAFSITFMAISIQIPNLPLNNMTEQQFITKLLQLLPQFEIYAVSFMIVGIYWILIPSLRSYRLLLILILSMETFTLCLFCMLQSLP